MPESMLKINLKPLARKDLLNIWQYSYNSWGAAQADKYLQGLEKAFKRLSSTPKLGRIIEEVMQGIRIHPHEHHLIIYKVSDTSIEVVRVLHGRMDIQRQPLQ